MSLVVQKGLCLSHIDVTAAYQNSPLIALVYMLQPWYWEGDGEDLVCLLKRSIYRLHQAGKYWYEYLLGILKKLGLKQCLSEPCVFVREMVDRGIYVDNLVLVGNDQEISKFTTHLDSEIKIKDMGEVSHLLGLEICRHSSVKITICQTIYIFKMLQEFNMMEEKVSSTPCMPGDTLDDQVGDSSFDQDIYSKAIGCLLYIATCTRPDIRFAVGKLSKFCNDPSQGNWKNSKRVMRYLKYTSDLKLTYSGLEIGVEVLCYADWANDKNDGKSIEGYVVIMGGGTVCWKSKKQQLVAT
ncbi:hypothetical protein PR048_026962 [Dryococelus australis]|uniref:Reverse transcriptase Ty1/copia-type domain-containing protein n=1 Tax=Dryococelus australis TaxID=614101 RepID=A0ABQ9GMT8_9NEOP|nr:hypothetical protein PR048_026962 [Dryococelus australis]